MAATPRPQDRQVARANAELRVQRPTWREAAAWGAALGAALGVLGVVDPVLPLGSTEPAAAGGVARTLRLIVLDALIGAVVCSIGAFLVRAVRKAVLAARNDAPVA